jgi:L-alanine-DL-glutamate epimerase-like enolase superfamily enzyme
VLASIPNGLTLEYMGWLDDLWVETPLPVDGKMRPPQRPGHGLAVRPEAIKEFRAK